MSNINIDGSLSGSKLSSKIYVARPSLPPLREFIPYLEDIWDSRQLTNSAKYHVLFEKALCEYLRVDHISLVSNATLGLVLAIQAAELKGEVITTPYSFVATSHALVWNNIKPVFVDVCPATFNLDPEKIEEAITAHTTGILAVHCYGNPCNTDAIDRIAKRYGLKVIYDAAHAFGVKCHCESLFQHGDFSVLSFHATKVFNTFEGGAIVSPNEESKKRIDYLRNFGFRDEVTVESVGINAKMSEFNAALGLLQLNYVDQAIDARKEVALQYFNELTSVKGIEIPQEQPSTTSNYSYFPIFVGPDYRLTRDELYSRLKTRGIFCRRYFFPLLTDFSAYSSSLSNASKTPNATRLSEQVLCLPIFEGLETEDIKRVTEAIKGFGGV